MNDIIDQNSSTIPTDWLTAYITWWQSAVRAGRDAPNDAFRAGWYAALLAASTLENQDGQ